MGAARYASDTCRHEWIRHFGCYKWLDKIAGSMY
jgi:hypothetical protein